MTCERSWAWRIADPFSAISRACQGLLHTAVPQRVPVTMTSALPFEVSTTPAEIPRPPAFVSRPVVAIEKSICNSIMILLRVSTGS